LRHLDWFDHQAEKIKKAREQLLSSLAGLVKVTVYPSAANFLLFRVADGRGEAVFSNLKQQGVLVKSLHGAHPQLADCLRVTVSTSEENQLFIDALQVALQ
ncbi:MAG: aminotransferase class I/II-fold pyridoxal phosphate-dependent enzyme, partial [Gammaproteobacteria bacterium]